jgi:hypothetical protein
MELVSQRNSTQGLRSKKQQFYPTAPFGFMTPNESLREGFGKFDSLH